MKTLIVVLISTLVAGIAFEVHFLYKEQQAQSEKLKQATAALDQLDKSVKLNDTLFQQQLEAEKQRDQNVGNSLQDKKNQLKSLQARLVLLLDHADLDQKKELAAAYLNKEKIKMNDLQTQIKSLQSGRRTEQNGEHGVEQDLDINYHQQDAALATRITQEQQTLNQMNAQLAQIKVVKSDPSTRDAYNSQKQAIAIQKSVVDSFKQQRSDLGRQHTAQRDDMHAQLKQDGSSVDDALITYQQDLTHEKTYYDQADKSNRQAQVALDTNRAKVKELQGQIQVLQNEIHDLELAR